MAKAKTNPWDSLPDVEPARKPNAWDGLPDVYVQENVQNGLPKNEEGFLESVANKIDSYTGAPVRKAVGTLQEGKGLGSALSSGMSQFGEDPRTAPSAKEIALKSGISDEKRTLPKSPYALAKLGMVPDAPMERESMSLADLASYPIEMGLDVTNLPLVAPIKYAGKGASAGFKALSKIARPVEKLENAVARAGKFGVNTILGVPKESIDYYLKNLDRLGVKVDSNAMIQELSGELDKGLDPFRKKLDLAEKAVVRAKELKSENVADLVLRQQDAKEALKLAQDQALGEAAARVSTKVQDLNKATSEGSQKAFSILDAENVTVPITPIKSDLTRGIKMMEARALTDQDVAIVDVLKRYRERLDKFGKTMSGGEAKRQIQAIDKEISFLAPGDVGRLSKDDQILGILRRRFDEPLKGSSPAYAEQMQKVSSDTRLLKSVSEMAGPEGASRALKAAQTAGGAERLAAIRALEQRFGTSFIDELKRQNLPEFQRLVGLTQKTRSARKGLGVKQAEAELKSLQNTVGEAASVGDQGLAGISDRVRSYVAATNPKEVAGEKLFKAGEVSKINMPERLQDIKTISSFEKGYNRGSANTNMWGAVLGGLFGSVAGPAGMVGGAATGAAFGRSVIDNFGPAIGRRILDQAPKLEKMKPSKWISQLDVPKAVKLKLEDSLYLYQAQQKARASVAGSKMLKDEGEK